MTTSSPFPAIEDLPSIDLANPGRSGPGVAALRARAVEEGRTEGFSMGFAEGRVAAMAQARDEVAAALGALASATEQLHRRDALGAADVSAQAVELALAIAEAVIGRELAVAREPGADAIARALALAPDSGPVVARLHPLDVETLADVDALAPGRDLHVVPDPTVERGGCRMEVGPARIDAQVSTALERVRAELLGPDPEEPVDEADWDATVAR